MATKTGKRAVRKPATAGAQTGAQGSLRTESRVDIERFSEDFRLGSFTTREMGAKHGVSEAYVRKLAKQLGLKKDLAEKVRARVRENVVRNTVRANPKDDEIAVAQAAEAPTALVLSHQKGLAKQRKTVDMLAEQLNFAATHRDDLAKVLAVDPADEKELAAARRTVAKLLGLSVNAAVARDLTVAYGNVIKLERQAFNLDADGAGDKDGDLAALIKAGRERTLQA